MEGSVNQPGYVAFMRVLEGDMEGLRHASRTAQGRTQPYFEIVKTRPRKSDRGASFVVRAADWIVDTWRLKGPAFVELVDEPGPEENNWFPSQDHTLVLLHRYFRQKNVTAIPTIPLDRTGPYREAFLKVASVASSGMAVRLYADDLELPSETIAKLRKLGLEARRANSEIDLIINVQRIKLDQLNLLRSKILDFLAALAAEAPYRSITLVGTSVPESLSEVVPENEEREVPRLELRLWREVCAAYGRLIGLGDYLIVRPEYDDRKGGFDNINAKIFYTTDKSTYIVRGKSRKKEKLEDQYPNLTQRLTRSGVFQDAEFSWGDARIAEYAQRGQAPGSPKIWIVIGISHHIELVSAQVAVEFARAE
ncbi:MAG: hypothetical protein A3F74_19855 [Betaproteobacteria bacterium RIFCSPLOWO2_12_FULL_62_58]|nr:MAG: hypothetical protein A3F74_19855 [Betaproteobacteria bacterium RIFCSPLOWO2_12_FULL_62_58]